MNILGTIAIIVVGVVSAAVLVAFLRALTARLLTGKWPHQSEEAQAIYRSLP